MPRFFIPGTDGKGVFLSKYDYLEYISCVTRVVMFQEKRIHNYHNDLN